MTKPDKPMETDKQTEKEKAGEHRTDAVVDEATKSKADLIKQQRLELKMQKDPNRPASDTSLKFGKPDIVDEGGKKLVKGTVTAKDASPPPLEGPAKVKEKHPANWKPGHPFEEIVYEDGSVRDIRPGGTIVEKRKDMIITASPDHTVSIQQDGESRQVKPMHPERGVKNTEVDNGGMVTYFYADGTTEAVFSSGTHRIYDKDASNAKDYDKDGHLIQERKSQNDHTTVTRDAKGRVTETWGRDETSPFRMFNYGGPNGELTSIQGKLGSWKRQVDKDTGKVYWQNGEKPDVKWYGNMTVDKEGNIHYKPHDVNAHGWVFTRDGRDVMQPPANAPKASSTDHHEARPPVKVDTSVAVPRDLFEKEGTPSTVKAPKDRSNKSDRK